MCTHKRHFYAHIKETKALGMFTFLSSENSVLFTRKTDKNVSFSPSLHSPSLTTTLWVTYFLRAFFFISQIIIPSSTCEHKFFEFNGSHVHIFVILQVKWRGRLITQQTKKIKCINFLIRNHRVVMEKKKMTKITTLNCCHTYCPRSVVI